MLGLVASSSSSERNWSTYSFIHSLKINRFRLKKAENLVYIHSTLLLIYRKDQGTRRVLSRNVTNTQMMLYVWTRTLGEFGGKKWASKQIMYYKNSLYKNQ